MIWLLPHPSILTVTSTGDKKTKKERKFADGRGEE
jgi:hypothetical protein